VGQIIADIQRNASEIVRVEVSEFKGKELINIRIWYMSIDPQNGDQVYKPTQKGFALGIERFEELKNAVQRIGNYINDKDHGTQPEQFKEAELEDIDEQELETDEQELEAEKDENFKDAE
jgi:hypothetical protein